LRKPAVAILAVACGCIAAVICTGLLVMTLELGVLYFAVLLRLGHKFLEMSDGEIQLMDWIVYGVATLSGGVIGFFAGRTIYRRFYPHTKRPKPIKNVAQVFE
jgi:hypothetical protein